MYIAGFCSLFLSNDAWRRILHPVQRPFGVYLFSTSYWSSHRVRKDSISSAVALPRSAFSKQERQIRSRFFVWFAFSHIVDVGKKRRIHATAVFYVLSYAYDVTKSAPRHDSAPRLHYYCIRIITHTNAHSEKPVRALSVLSQIPGVRRALAFFSRQYSTLAHTTQKNSFHFLLVTRTW